VVGLKPDEQKRIEATFWGSNYTAGEIIENAKKGDQNTLKHLKENVPKGLFEKALQAQVKHYA
jgi:porphobilinogen deaminase